jgi:hypothetical protein
MLKNLILILIHHLSKAIEVSQPEKKNGGRLEVPEMGFLPEVIHLKQKLTGKNK